MQLENLNEEGEMTRKPRGKRRPPKVSFRRRDEEFAGLNIGMHPKTRWEYIDIDYIDKLSDSDKRFLSKMIDEYYGATLAPADQPELWKGDLHPTSKERKDCTDRNNARNRDMYTILRTRGMVEEIQQEDNTNPAVSDDILKVDSFVTEDTNLQHENIINELIDRHDEKVASLNKKERQAHLNLLKDRQEKKEESQ